METSPNMTMTMTSVLDRAAGIGDPGRVDGDGGVRPDPEVPERARRRRFTAAYKLEVLAAYDAGCTSGNLALGTPTVSVQPCTTHPGLALPR